MENTISHNFSVSWCILAGGKYHIPYHPAFEFEENTKSPIFVYCPSFQFVENISSCAVISWIVLNFTWHKILHLENFFHHSVSKIFFVRKSSLPSHIFVCQKCSVLEDSHIWHHPTNFPYCPTFYLMENTVSYKFLYLSVFQFVERTDPLIFCIIRILVYRQFYIPKNLPYLLPAF